MDESIHIHIIGTENKYSVELDKIFEAIKTRNIKIFRDNFNISCVDKHLLSIISLASEYGAMSILEYLYSINKLNKCHGCILLRSAVYNDNQSLYNYAMNTVGVELDMALATAIECREIEMAKYLMREGAKFNTVTGPICYQYAISSDNITLLNLVLSNITISTKQLNRILKNTNPSETALIHLVRHGCDIHGVARSAVRCGYVKVLNLVIDGISDINEIELLLNEVGENLPSYRRAEIIKQLVNAITNISK